MKKLVVLDYGSGNVRSVSRALARLGGEVVVTAEEEAALDADGLVVPGVGAFASVMAGLRAVNAPRIIERRLAGGRAVLGICVGLQVMFESGTEHGIGCAGLAQWPGVVERLPARVLPHMGWSHIAAPGDSVLFDGVASERFYFVHSYGVCTDPAGAMSGPLRPPLVTWSNHGCDFVAAVENGALCATQFHPEKSAEAGAHLLENWVRSL